MKDTLLITHIGELLQIRQPEEIVIKGDAMKMLPSIKNAFVWIENGKIADFGTMQDLDPKRFDQAEKHIDAHGGTVLPSWADSHTHIVYAGSREMEFVDKIKGLSYEQIAANGGGILNSSKRLQTTSEDDLFDQSKKRLEEVMNLGTGAIEIKSGYGLTVEDELKMLRVIKRLKEEYPIPVKSTFLGAHAFPAEYTNDHNGYVDLIINEMIPRVAEEKLADYIDVFCDRGFFTPEETERILAAGEKVGLPAKIHANELDYSGGIQVGVKHRARSVDHLEFTGEDEINTLLKSETMPTLLPSTAFYLNLEFPPARKMIDAGLPVALASDYNPGSSPSGRMAFVISLACIKMKMLPAEAINAATVNGAYAMGLENEVGSITRGKRANLIITKPVSNYEYIPYAFGSDLIENVLINGRILK
jgi:imidazolonepropionase